MGKALRKCLPVSCCAALAMGIAGSVQAQQQMSLPINVYYAAVAAGYWFIQGEVPANGGKWVYCRDIGPATGWYGGANLLDPRTQVVVPAGNGGWGWDNGKGFPCAQVQRTTVIVSPQPVPSPSGGSGGSGGSPGQPSGTDLYNDINRSNRSR